MWFARVAVRSDRSGATQGRPRSHADGPRRGPQRLKTASRGPQRRPEAPRRAWERLRSDFRAILGLPGPRKTSRNAVLSANFGKGAFNRGPRSSKRSSRGTQVSPRRALGGPRSDPRAPKTAPRAARCAPRGAQDHPGPPQESTQGAPSRPDASREPFGSPFWPHLGAPGGSWSSLLGVLFEPRARSARQTKTLVEITGQKVFRDRCGPDVQRPLSTKLLN